MIAWARGKSGGGAGARPGRDRPGGDTAATGPSQPHSEQKLGTPAACPAQKPNAHGGVGGAGRRAACQHGGHGLPPTRSLRAHCVGRGARYQHVRHQMRPRADQAGGRRRPRAGGHPDRHGRHLRQPGRLGDAAGRDPQGPARRRGPGHQIRDGHGDGTGGAGVPPLHPPGGREQPAEAPDRLHRPLPDARPRSEDADRRDTRGARRAGRRGQGPLPRVVQLRRLADRRRGVDGADPALHPFRVRPEQLQPPRTRRGGRGHPGLPALRDRHSPLLPAGLGTADRQVPP